MENDVKRIIADVLMVDPNEIQDDSSPDSIDAWDSLKQMNIIIALEEELNINFTDDQVVEMLNVKLIINAIKELA